MIPPLLAVLLLLPRGQPVNVPPRAPSPVTQVSSAENLSTRRTRYYLSLDMTKDGADLPLTAARSVVSLAPGATSTGSKLVTVPLSAAAGTYYVLACADDPLKVWESDNGNNCRASGATVLIHP